MFSASRRIRSSSSLLLFLFAIFLENLSDTAYGDDQIGQCSDDTEHLLTVDQPLHLAAVHHPGIL